MNKYIKKLLHYKNDKLDHYLNILRAYEKKIDFRIVFSSILTVSIFIDLFISGHGIFNVILANMSIMIYVFLAVMRSNCFTHDLSQMNNISSTSSHKYSHVSFIISLMFLPLNFQMPYEYSYLPQVFAWLNMTLYLIISNIINVHVHNNYSINHKIEAVIIPFNMMIYSVTVSNTHYSIYRTSVLATVHLAYEFITNIGMLIIGSNIYICNDASLVNNSIQNKMRRITSYIFLIYIIWIMNIIPNIALLCIVHFVILYFLLFTSDIFRSIYDSFNIIDIPNLKCEIEKLIYSENYSEKNEHTSSIDKLFVDAEIVSDIEKIVKNNIYRKDDYSTYVDMDIFIANIKKIFMDTFLKRTDEIHIISDVQKVTLKHVQTLLLWKYQISEDYYELSGLEKDGLKFKSIKNKNTYMYIKKITVPKFDTHDIFMIKHISNCNYVTYSFMSSILS